MIDVKNLSIAGMHYDGAWLWIAAPEEHLIATYDPLTGKMQQRLTYIHETWDICSGDDGFWMVTGGGRLGRQIVLWSLSDGKEVRKFNCPDGACAGMTLLDRKLWLTHRHNRKLICLDLQSGKVNWVIRTENEAFSPAAYKNELWFIESDPGALGHWSETHQVKYFFSRFDPARERIVERLSVPFIPRCMAFDGKRFWYAQQEKMGLFSLSRSDCR